MYQIVKLSISELYIVIELPNIWNPNKPVVWQYMSTVERTPVFISILYNYIKESSEYKTCNNQILEFRIAFGTLTKFDGTSQFCEKNTWTAIL